MFLNTQSFYFATTRKITVAFGSLFNNIQISRYAENGGLGAVLKTIKVPLAYSPGEKWLIHAKEDVTAQAAVSQKANKKTRIRTSLPRLGFELTGMQYDANRKLQTLNSRSARNPDNVDQLLRQLNPVPYDFSYDLNIAVKNVDDGLQIIEQILPNFTPSYNLNVNDIPELSIVTDVPVIFSAISQQDTYEGSFEENRIITWTLSFIVKGYLYPVINDAEIIKKVIANLYPTSTMEDPKTAIVTVRVDPIESDIDDSNYTIVENIFEGDDIDSNGDPITDSNGDAL